MTRLLLIALITPLATGCGDQTLQTNTPEYFKAHGIEQGQPNELRIGATLFRFAAGVGLNPYTSQVIVRSKDGSPMTLSTKEGLDQGKYERVNRPIVNGQADAVTFHLDPARGYAPGSNPFGGGVRVEIHSEQNLSWDGVNANLKSYLKEISGRKIIEHPVPGLREYVSPEPWGSTFEDVSPDAKTASGYGKFFRCQGGGTGFCFINYWNPAGRYRYEIVVNQKFVLAHWPQLPAAVAHYVDSIAVK